LIPLPLPLYPKKTTTDSPRLEEVIVGVDCTEGIGETCAGVDSAVGSEANVELSGVVTGDFEEDSVEVTGAISAVEARGTGEEGVKNVVVGEAVVVCTHCLSWQIHISKISPRLP
jgi:hypothetical protein